MQPTATFIGIDISKLTLDICVLKESSKQHYIIDNYPDAIKTFFISFTGAGSSYIAMENTGCYNYHLYEALSSLELSFYVIPPVHLKKSLGLSRGKNDKIDAYRIALFLEMNLKRLSVYKPQGPQMRNIQLLLSVRNQRIEIKKQLMAASEQYIYAPDSLSEPLSQMDNTLINSIVLQVKELEARIQAIITSDAELSLIYKLISSVQGVGKVLSWHLLLKTGGFSLIREPRKLACYAGVAPFEHSSGTSIRGRSKVSHYADKTLKKLLHMAAMSAIRLEGDLRDYYQRKVAEGKNKMSVLNAVRNKIIHRVYAVLKNQRTYQKYLPQSLPMS